MTDSAATRTLATALVELMRSRGTDRLFTVPGEAALELLAAAGDAHVQLVTTRHESGAGFAAIADAQMTGRPGFVVVNRSPGAANVGIAVDTTRCDPTPLVVVVGAPARTASIVLGYQSARAEAQLGAVSLCLRIEVESDVAEALRALADELDQLSPRPVVLIVPQDMWSYPVPGLPARSTIGISPVSTDELVELAKTIDAADRPVTILGPQLRSRSARFLSARLEKFAFAAQVPLLAGNKRIDLIDHHSDGGLCDFSWLRERSGVAR